MSYQSYPGEVIDVEYAEVTPALPRTGFGLLPLSSSAAMSKVIKDAMLMSTRDQCIAMLAKAGLEHTAVLSVMEAQFSSITPQSSERYREIVDGYAQQVVNNIRRW